MAIHSKGKHAAKKAVIKRDARRAPAEERAGEREVSAALADTPDERSADPREPVDVAAGEGEGAEESVTSPDQGADAQQPTPANDDQQGEPSEKTPDEVSDKGTDEATDKATDEATDKAADEVKPADAGRSKRVGKHAKDAKDEKRAGAKASDKAASAGAVVSLGVSGSASKEGAFKLGDAKAKRARSAAKKLGIFFAAIIGIVGIAYLGGVALFATHFYPNTNISMVDISLDSPERAAEELDETVGSFSFRVKGQGMNLTVTSDQVGMDLDAELVTDAVLASQVPWEWPAQVFEKHDVTEAVAEAMSASSLSGVIEEAVAQVNAAAKAPVNASVIFKEDVGKFYIAPEEEGTMLDPQKVVEKAMDGVLALKKDIVLKKDERLDPLVTQDDQRLMDACAKANQLAGADITLTLDGDPASNVNATTIGEWVSVTPEFEVLFNDEELAQWAEGIGDQFDTVGSERTYTRPDGKVVTVKGGSYGWKVDGDALEEAIIDAVQNEYVGTLEIPVVQSGRGFTALGSQDWGARYVDVDLTEQHARFYDSDGDLVWESDIVSGAKGSHDSPTGVYAVNHKQSPTVLIGQMTSDGTPEYESEVTYWMPFKGNSVGLHDASWQSAFGGSRYASGFGSHGCINLPTDAAGELYEMIEPGDVVVVHY